MYAGKNFKRALKQAQANADYFGQCYLIMFDTNQNIRIEHCSAPWLVVLTGASQIVYPSNYRGKRNPHDNQPSERIKQ